MKKLHKLVPAVIAAIGAMGGASAFAADVYWDGADANAANNVVSSGAGLGGAGTWDAVTSGNTLNWWDGSSASDQAWNDANNDNAIFWGPTAGTVTLAESRTASGLNFKTSGYTLTGNTITLAGGTGTVNIDTGTATIASIVGGSTGLTKTGAGTLALTTAGTNNFTGAITVSAGTLAISSPNQIGGVGAVSNPLTINGGTLDFTNTAGVTYESNQFTGGRTLSFGDNGATIHTTTAALTTAATYNGPVTSTAGAVVTKTGNGTFFLASNSVGFLGKWVISGGEFNPGNAAAADDGFGHVPGSPVADFIKINGPGTQSTPIGLRFGASAAFTMNVNRGITLNGGGTIDTVSGSANVTIAGVITGTGPLSLVSSNSTPGIVALTNTDTYTGNTIMSGGSVVRADDGVGIPNTNIAGSGNVSIGAGTWETAANITRNLGTTGANTIQMTAGVGGFSARNGAVVVSLGGLLSPTSLVWGTGGFAPTSLTLNGTNANNSLEFRNPVDLNAAARTITVNAAAAANAATMTGVISGIGASALTKAGAGTLILANDNTYAGGTTISTGVLQLGNGGTTGSVTGNIVDNATVAFNRSDNFTLAGAISGTGALIQAGAGTLVLNSPNTYAGNTTVNGGTLQVNNNNTLGSTTGSTITLNNGTTFRLGADFSINNTQRVFNVGTATLDTGGFGNNDPSGWSCTINGTALTIIGSGNGELYHAGAVNVSSFTFGNGGRFCAFNDSALGAANSPLTFDGGTLGFNSDFTTSNRTINVTSNGGTITTQGRFGSGTVHPHTVTDIGALTGSGALTHKGQGALVMTGDTTGFTGAFNVIADSLFNNTSGGTVSLQTNLLNTSGVSVSGTSSVLQLATGGSNNRLIKTPTVATTNGGEINLQDNKLIVTTLNSIGTLSGIGGTYSGVQGQVQSGRAGGAWNGTGIITSQSNAVSTNQLMTLGVDTAGDAGKLMFGNVPVTTTDTLVMYTYAGDANLSGSVTGDDYARIDAGFAAQNTSLSGYANGDFNYDGKINADDYFLIDRSYAAQGGTIIPAAPALGGVSAVPEPASLGLLMLAGMGLRRRRRTRV